MLFIAQKNLSSLNTHYTTHLQFPNHPPKREEKTEIIAYASHKNGHKIDNDSRERTIKATINFLSFFFFLSISLSCPAE
jgi:hypothetical protein